MTYRVYWDEKTPEGLEFLRFKDCASECEADHMVSTLWGGGVNTAFSRELKATVDHIERPEPIEQIAYYDAWSATPGGDRYQGPRRYTDSFALNAYADVV